MTQKEGKSRRAIRRQLTIKFRGSFTPTKMYEFLVTVGTFYHATSEIPNPKRTVILDFGELRAIQVGGVAVISNLVELMMTSKFRVRVRNLKSCSARDFLVGAGFLALYAGDQYAPDDKCFLPLRLIDSAQSYFYIENGVVPWIAACFDRDPRELASLKACLMEIYNNISDHSGESIGCSCAHFDKVKGRVTICVSDFGVGIPARVRKIKPDIPSDAHAIQQACVEGFTTKSTHGNMGAGLPNLLNCIVNVNSGELRIFSMEGILVSVKDSDGIRRESRSHPTVRGARYPGTIIYAILEKEKFSPDEIGEKDYEWNF